MAREPFGAFMRVTNRQSMHTDSKSGCVRVVFSQPMVAPLVDEKGIITKAAPTALSSRNMLQVQLDLTAEPGDQGVWVKVNSRGEGKLMKVKGAVLITLEGASSTQ